MFFFLGFSIGFITYLELLTLNRMFSKPKLTMHIISLSYKSKISSNNHHINKIRKYILTRLKKSCTSGKVNDKQDNILN